MLIKLANLFSVILNPFIVLLVAVVTVIFKSSLPEEVMIKLLVFVVVIGFGVPFVLLKFAVMTKKIGDFDISDRSERRIPLLILLIMLIFDILVINYIAGFIMATYFIFFGMWAVGFTLITYFWKISGHASVNTLAALLIINIFGLSWWPVLFIIPLVSWSRVVRGDHTLLQVICGFIYSVLIFTLFFYIA